MKILKDVEEKDEITDRLFVAFFQNEKELVDDLISEFSYSTLKKAFDTQAELMSTDEDNIPLYQEFLNFGLRVGLSKFGWLNIKL